MWILNFAQILFEWKFGQGLEMVYYHSNLHFCIEFQFQCMLYTFVPNGVICCSDYIYIFFVVIFFLLNGENKVKLYRERSL